MTPHRSSQPARQERIASGRRALPLLGVAAVGLLSLAALSTSAAEPTFSILSESAAEVDMPALVLRSELGQAMAMRAHRAYADKEHVYDVVEATQGRICIVRITSDQKEPEEAAMLCARPVSGFALIEHRQDETKDVTVVAADGWVTARLGSISSPVVNNVAELSGVPESADDLTLVAGDGSTSPVA